MVAAITRLFLSSLPTRIVLLRDWDYPSSLNRPALRARLGLKTLQLASSLGIQPMAVEHVIFCYTSFPPIDHFPRGTYWIAEACQ